MAYVMDYSHTVLLVVGEVGPNDVRPRKASLDLLVLMRDKGPVAAEPGAPAVGRHNTEVISSVRA